MSDAPRFLVFTRLDRFPWGLHRSEATLAEAVQVATLVIEKDVADRAVVMEVGSVDEMPMFTYKFRAPAKKS